VSTGNAGWESSKEKDEREPDRLQTRKGGSCGAPERDLYFKSPGIKKREKKKEEEGKQDGR